MYIQNCCIYWRYRNLKCKGHPKKKKLVNQNNIKLWHTWKLCYSWDIQKIFWKHRRWTPRCLFAGRRGIRGFSKKWWLGGVLKTAYELVWFWDKGSRKRNQEVQQKWKKGIFGILCPCRKSLECFWSSG